MLIDDAEAGGAKYNTHLYASYVDVFKESNNYENKEALWKHRWSREMVHMAQVVETTD